MYISLLYGLPPPVLNELNQANDRIKMLIAAGDMMEPYATQQTAELWAKAKENK